VKWFLALLVVLAAGIAWAAFAVPTNAAVVNGSAISQQQLNSDVTAIAGSPDYQCYLNSQAALQQQRVPPPAGAGKGQGGQVTTATTAFTASYLDTEVSRVLIEQLANQKGVTTSSTQEADARASYEGQITNVMQQAAQETQDPRYTCGAVKPLTGEEVLATLPASFVDDQVALFATISALQEDFAGVKPTETGLRAYFATHHADFDIVCTTAALYSSAGDATTALQQAQSTPFSEVAKQALRSGTFPCAPLPVVVAQLEQAAGLPSTFRLGDLPVGTVSFPIPVQNGDFLLLQITRRTPATYDEAKQVLALDVQNKGGAKTQDALNAAARHATVSVDPRYGLWNPAKGNVLVPFTPEPSDVLNAGANTAPAFTGPTNG